MSVTIVRDELRALYDHGRLTPRSVVAVARPPESPLHSRFEWDDAAAGEAYRLVQAAHLIRQVKVEIIRHDGTATKVRAFVHIPGPVPHDGEDDGEESPDTGYIPQDVVAGSPEMSRVALREMERRWKEMRRAYQDCSEFWSMVSADVAAA